MDERQWPARREDPRPRQQFGCVSCLLLFEPGESGRLEEIGLLEDREGPSQPAGWLWEPAKPKSNRATDGSCADSLDMVRGLCGRRDPFFVQRLDEHAHQEGRSSRCAQAGID